MVNIIHFNYKSSWHVIDSLRRPPIQRAIMVVALGALATLSAYAFATGILFTPPIIKYQLALTLLCIFSYAIQQQTSAKQQSQRARQPSPEIPPPLERAASPEIPALPIIQPSPRIAPHPEKQFSPDALLLFVREPSPELQQPAPAREPSPEPQPSPIRQPSPELQQPIPVRAPSPEPQPSPIRQPSPELLPPPAREPSPELQQPIPVRAPSPEPQPSPIRQPSPEPQPSPVREPSPELQQPIPVRAPSPELPPPVRQPSPKPQAPQQQAQPSASAPSQKIAHRPERPITQLPEPAQVLPKEYPFLYNNICVISNFPNSDNAQIKADTSGALSRTDGSDWALNWVKTKLGYITEFDGTVAAINGTFKVVADTYATLSNNVLQRIYFQRELSMLNGLRNIRIVYQKRYNTPYHKTLFTQWFKANPATKQNALRDLDTIIDKWTPVIEQHKNSLIQAGFRPPKPMQKFTPEYAANCLDGFVSMWSHNVSLEEAWNLIKNGRVLMSKVLKGELIPFNNSEDSKQKVTALMWHLMNLALLKKQGHDAGSFAIEDQNGYLYNFLSSTIGSGDRLSSHYVGRSEPSTDLTSYVMKSSKHKGIDVESGKLPGNKRHVLFGQVDARRSNGKQEKILFIKLEDFSPFLTTGYGYDFMMHAYELGVAQYNKKFYPGSDDLPEMAKERVPVSISEEFRKQIGNLGLNNLIVVDQKMREKGFEETPEKAAKKYGIAYMAAFFEEAGKLKTVGANFNLAQFSAMLTQLDHINKRTGREVYLEQTELLK